MLTTKVSLIILTAPLTISITLGSIIVLVEITNVSRARVTWLKLLRKPWKCQVKCLSSQSTQEPGALGQKEQAELNTQHSKLPLFFSGCSWTVVKTSSEIFPILHWAKIHCTLWKDAFFLRAYLFSALFTQNKPLLKVYTFTASLTWQAPANNPSMFGKLQVHYLDGYWIDGPSYLKASLLKHHYWCVIYAGT